MSSLVNVFDIIIIAVVNIIVSRFLACYISLHNLYKVYLNIINLQCEILIQNLRLNKFRFY